MNKLKIAVPIAAYETGTTGEYVARAFRKLGHEADILSQWQFYDDFKTSLHDLYFCVDSGGALNLFESSIMSRDMDNVAFWMIDYRRGKSLKQPNDKDTCKLLGAKRGWVFQSQFEDMYECISYTDRVSWLSLAADEDVWSSSDSGKIYDVGFVGNVWDGVRQGTLDRIRTAGLSLCFQGHGTSYMESGAALLNASRVGFNISSFFGENIAYDVNMRVFETLACGIPLITNDVPSLYKIFGNPLPLFIRTYRTLDEALSLLKTSVIDEQFVALGQDARNWILSNATYTIRMQMALDILQLNGAIP